MELEIKVADQRLFRHLERNLGGVRLWRLRHRPRAPRPQNPRLILLVLICYGV